MKREDGQDWRDAVTVDTAIRHKRPPYPLYVHPARLPLEQAVQIPEDYGYEQPELCDSGYCMV